MKDILVSYTRQEKDEATGNYLSVNHKGYIQHWDCCPTYTMAIILSIEGKFHSVSIDKIQVEKEDMPQTKNNPEINHKGVNTNRKGANLNIYDRYSHEGRRKYPKGIILLAQSLKEDYPTTTQTRINTNIQTIPNIYLYNIH